MKQLKVRFAEKNEAEQILEWLHQQKGNDFDPDILAYPTLRLLCSYDSLPVSYLPIHHGLVLESTAHNPAATEQETAQAIRDLVKAAQIVASSAGIKELYFIVSDERIKKIAANHGFEEKVCMRLKL